VLPGPGLGGPTLAGRGGLGPVGFDGELDWLGSWDGCELLSAGWSADGAVLRPEEIASAVLEGEGAEGC